jgi:hypothetical protein
MEIPKDRLTPALRYRVIDGRNLLIIPYSTLRCLVMMPFLQYSGFRAGRFYGLSAGEFCPLRIPLDKLGAAGSPTDKP